MILLCLLIISLSLPSYLLIDLPLLSFMQVIDQKSTSGFTETFENTEMDARESEHRKYDTPSRSRQRRANILLAASRLSRPCKNRRILGFHARAMIPPPTE